jgi:hypothetical protein
MVSVRSVKNGKSHRPIGGISVALKSAKGEIRVSENQTLGLRRWVKVYFGYDRAIFDRVMPLGL